MMSFKTVLAHVDGHERGTANLRIGAELAQRFDGHLAAIFSSEPMPLAVSPTDPALAVALEYHEEIRLDLEDRAKAQVAGVEAAFGIPIEWRTTRHDVAGELALHARHADLLVMGQENPAESTRIGPPIAARVVMHTGRPILLVPCEGTFESCGESVLIAWNAGREAARAVADALPLLRLAKQINVVSINPDKTSGWGEIPGADIGLWLARHEVRVTVRDRHSHDDDVGNQLLSQAAKLGADLIVIGAYGHSRAIESMLGGVTRTILARMNVPVLMSH